jgi:hypothetical protein
MHRLYSCFIGGTCACSISCMKGASEIIIYVLYYTSLFCTCKGSLFPCLIVWGSKDVTKIKIVKIDHRCEIMPCVIKRRLGFFFKREKNIYWREIVSISKFLRFFKSIFLKMVTYIVYNLIYTLKISAPKRIRNREYFCRFP